MTVTALAFGLCKKTVCGDSRPRRIVIGAEQTMRRKRPHDKLARNAPNMETADEGAGGWMDN